MPDVPDRGSVGVWADLDLTVTTDRGTATAHLGGGADGLVLDVDRPAVFLQALPRTARRVPDQLVGRLDADIPLVLRSHDRDLARLRVTPTGRLRVRPTAAGLRTAGAIALTDSRSQRWLLVAASAFGAVWSVLAVRRRTRS